ncbi:MAG: hypothetical protein AB1810_12230 [Pseudomonadota bacterium]
MLLSPRASLLLAPIFVCLSACAHSPSGETPPQGEAIEQPVAAPAAVRAPPVQEVQAPPQGAVEPSAPVADESANPAKQRLLAMVAAQKQQVETAKRVQAPAGADDLEKRLNFAKMLFMGKTGRRVAESTDADVLALFEEAKLKLAQAERLLAGSDTAGAQAAIADTMRLFNAAAAQVPSEDLKVQAKAEYPKLLEKIAVAKDAHQRNFERRVAAAGMAAGVMYDEELVDDLLAEALVQAATDDFLAANKTLTAALRQVQAATREMLNHQTIVYELNIDTPEGEYQYELNRYLGYEELIPVAIEKYQPNVGQRLLVHRTVEKAQWMAGQSREAAQRKEFPVAIRMMQEATTEIRKALKLMGVPDIG